MYLEEELTTITGMLRLCIAENAANTVTEETYRTTHAELYNCFEETEAKLAEAAPAINFLRFIFYI